jgi:outer membrane protein TolC
MQRNNALRLVLSLLLFPTFMLGQIRVTYSDFIAQIKQFHPLAQKASNMEQFGQFNYQAARGNYDPFLAVSHENKFLSGTNYYSLLQSEIKQPIFTSQFLKLGYDYGTGKYINPQLRTASVGLPYVGMEVALLQGMMIDKRRAEVLKAKGYSNYYSAEKKVQLNDLFFEASNRYFDCLFISKQMGLNSYFIRLAEERNKGIESMSASGERPDVDTVEAALFLQSRMLDLQSASIEFQKISNDLASYQWNESAAVANAVLLPIDSLDYYYEQSKRLVSLLLQDDSLNNPSLLKYVAFQEVLDTDKRLKKEMIKPKLNVNYNFLSGNPDDFQPAFSTNAYKWGLQLSFPLFLRQPINEYRMSRIVSDNNGLELKTKRNELTYKLNMLRQSISILSSQLMNAEKSVRYSKVLVEAEKQKFSLGESSLFLINTREAKWLESELKLAEYKLKFVKATLQVIYLNGDLAYQFN